MPYTVCPSCSVKESSPLHPLSAEIPSAQLTENADEQLRSRRRSCFSSLYRLSAPRLCFACALDHVTPYHVIASWTARGFALRARDAWVFAPPLSFALFSPPPRPLFSLRFCRILLLFMCIPRVADGVSIKLIWGSAPVPFGSRPRQ